jgi:hypothetical protein
MQEKISIPGVSAILPANKNWLRQILSAVSVSVFGLPFFNQFRRAFMERSNRHIDNILGDYSDNQASHTITQTLADTIDESRITANHESAVGSSAASDFDFVSKIAAELSSFTGNRNHIRAVLKLTIFGRPKNFCGMGFSTKNPCFHKTPLALQKEQA